MSLVNKVISIILKIVVVVSAILGTIFSVTASAETSVGGETAFMYFTIQSNILIALICLIGIFLIINNRIDNKVWHVIKLVGTVSITLTGFVFCFIIAPLMETGAFGVSSKQPFLGTVWWILILLGFVILIGLFYLWIADKIRKSKNNKV